MRSAVLTRQQTGSDGTYGTLVTDRGFNCFTVERPSVGEHPCIDPWQGQCLWLRHPREGNCYELQGVPGRTAILIHPANVWEQLLGCIALGDKLVRFNAGSIRPMYANGSTDLGLPSRDVMGVSNSRSTLQAFEESMNYEPFMLTVK